MFNIDRMLQVAAAAVGALVLSTAAVTAAVGPAPADAVQAAYAAATMERAHG